MTSEVTNDRVVQLACRQGLVEVTPKLVRICCLLWSRDLKFASGSSKCFGDVFSIALGVFERSETTRPVRPHYECNSRHDVVAYSPLLNSNDSPLTPMLPCNVLCSCLVSEASSRRAFSVHTPTTRSASSRTG